MTRRRTFTANMGLFLALSPGAVALAQDAGIYAPLTWTRGDVEIDSPVVPSAPSPSTPVTVAPTQTVTPYGPLIDSVAREHHLNPRLLLAMIHVESGYQQDAVSNKGAVGLMQVMPLTGARFGYNDLSNAPDNLRAGAAYLEWLLDHFDHNLELSIAAYNAGEGAVKKYGRKIPPYPETQAYVARVIARYRQNPMTISGADRTDQSVVHAMEKPWTVMHGAVFVLQAVGTLLLASPEHNDE